MKKITVEDAINKWLDMKLSTYDKMVYNGSIYLYDDGEEYADIRILTKRKYIYFKSVFKDEFYVAFPIKHFEFEKVMTKWVGDTFNLKGFKPQVIQKPVWGMLLDIPK